MKDLTIFECAVYLAATARAMIQRGLGAEEASDVSAGSGGDSYDIMFDMMIDAGIPFTRANELLFELTPEIAIRFNADPQSALREALAVALANSAPECAP